MIDINNASQAKNIINKNDTLPKLTTTDDFEQILRQIEESLVLIDDEEDMPQLLSNTMSQSLTSLESDATAYYMEVIQVTIDETTEQLSSNTYLPQEINYANGETCNSQDVYAFDAVLDNMVPHWFSPGGVSTENEITFVGSSIMTLHEFTSLLEQGWRPQTMNEAQVWRFNLQNSTLPLLQIVLKNDNASNLVGGSWSVSLRATASLDTQDSFVLQQLQQLRLRLEKINSSVKEVEMIDEFSQ